VHGRFVAGWARQASTGLVGIARHDGELGANQAIEYAKAGHDGSTLSADEIQARLRAKGIRVVNKLDLATLMKAEQRIAQEGQIGLRAFADNETMFQAIDRERELLQASAAEGTLVPTA
jgi:ferredoxin--NADP+ reductase